MLLPDFLSPRVLVFPPANPSKCFSIRILYTCMSAREASFSQVTNTCADVKQTTTVQ